MRIAEQSPRMCKDGSIRWYHGDTFVLTFEFNIQDDEGNPIEFKKTDKIEIFLVNYKSERVAKFEAIATGTLQMYVDEELSEKLVEGVYSLDARFNGEFITALMKKNKVVVE